MVPKKNLCPVRNRPSHQRGGRGVLRDVPHPEVAEAPGQDQHLQAGVRLRGRPGGGGAHPGLGLLLRHVQPDSWDELQRDSDGREGSEEEQTGVPLRINRWVEEHFNPGLT